MILTIFLLSLYETPYSITTLKVLIPSLGRGVVEMCSGREGFIRHLSG
jgi:hypothetical protein